MKHSRVLFAVFTLILATGWVVAQCIVTSVNGTVRWSQFQEYDPKTRPPLALPDAYTLALANLGTSTTQLHCVSASCLEATNKGWTGWRFAFSGTNAEPVWVTVFFDGCAVRGRFIGERPLHFSK